ncbi:MAG: hypothetical protein GF346_01850 [Candidatus Eisenbacteria bacterium]|nr:hypothetical protein [Candidatus Latescibacterota bacterium]MBD3301174.1 hypothetical protein [Candidatus Eisenbacteria bacterium]
MIKRASCVAVLLLALSGCGGGGESGESVENGERNEPVRAPYGITGLRQMEFDVDPTLLGFTYKDTTLDLQFAPPRGWPPLDPDLMDQTRAALKEMVPEGTRFHGDPVRIFAEQGRRLFMIVAIWRNWEMALNPLPGLGEYREQIRAAMPDVEIQEDTFLLGDIAVYQLLLRNPVLVNFRLILIREGMKPVQVDYLVPRALYPELVKGIEASIGSIRSLED